jgi:hypothetical protein
MRNFSLFLAVTLFTACAPVQTTPGTFCTNFKPIKPTQKEWLSLSDETAQQILAADEKFKQFCGK